MSILKRPEEVIMAVLGALFVVLTYAAASYFGAQGQTALLVAAPHADCAAASVFAVATHRAAWLWPACSACWPLAGGRISMPAASNRCRWACCSRMPPLRFQPYLVCGLDV